ncbi:hypothetical protein C8R45DRAFT_496098 [Mycena sanguinolenta]|nr:hypothetical protein C8R45DRAFT_496098 [Mycena sanguinolenta]
MFPGVLTMNNYINGGRGGAGGGVTEAVRVVLEVTEWVAMHDSAESFPQPRCHPETRTNMLEDLRDWALDPNPKNTILWLYGPAGAGKSAIMQTLAEQLRDMGRLGGCFFFKRNHATRGNAKTLFATIAYQLILGVPWLRTPISQVVENDPSIVVRSIEIQMQKLISEPCFPHGYRDSLAIIIDGLDECEDHGIHEKILHAIRNSSSEYTIPVRFFIASRPEPHIREVFDSQFYSGRYRSFNVEQSFEDVRKYLRDEFSRIHREHDTMKGIPLPWPSSDILWGLVQKSSGHFIYASTIIKFIDDKNYRPTERLAVVQDPSSPCSKSAFDPLDQLYMTILSAAPRQFQLIPILCAIVRFQLAACEIDQLLGLLGGETRLILRGLHSVLNVPRDNQSAISSHHASFLDFLKNPDRSGNFCAGTLNRQNSLAKSLLQFYVGPFQPNKIRFLFDLIRFIVSLPPSGALAELFPLIGSINPDYIFDPTTDPCAYFRDIVPWLKNTPSEAPADVIQLWEDYEFMFSIEQIFYDRRRLDPSVEHTVSPSPELLRILLSMRLLQHPLWALPAKLDLTWTDLRVTLCSLRRKVEHTLPIHHPQASYPWVAQDLALQSIRKLVKNHIDTDGGVNQSASHITGLHEDIYSMRDLEKAYTRSQSVSIMQRHDFVDNFNRNRLAWDIAYLVRLSPPCPVLHRELWLIPPSAIWSSLRSGCKLIYHVSKWLEARFENVLRYNSLSFFPPVFPAFDNGTHRVLAAGNARF